jgi:hypothetical protein
MRIMNDVNLCVNIEDFMMSSPRKRQLLLSHSNQNKVIHLKLLYSE